MCERYHPGSAISAVPLAVAAVPLVSLVISRGNLVHLHIVEVTSSPHTTWSIRFFGSRISTSGLYVHD